MFKRIIPLSLLGLLFLPVPVKAELSVTYTLSNPYYYVDARGEREKDGSIGVIINEMNQREGVQRIIYVGQLNCQSKPISGVVFGISQLRYTDGDFVSNNPYTPIYFNDGSAVSEVIKKVCIKKR